MRGGGGGGGVPGGSVPQALPGGEVWGGKDQHGG